MADARRGQLSAWLLKKKSGTAMVRVRQYNKRFFTLDFDAKIFSYSHSESSKKASTEIPFSDIVDVRLPERLLEPTASEHSESKRLIPSSSLLKRATSFGSNTGAKEEDSVVTVMTKPARTMELLCSSPAEAQQWLEAFHAAMVFDPGTDGAAPVRASQARAAVGGYPTGPSDATLAASAAVFDGAAAADDEDGLGGGGAGGGGGRGGRPPVASFGAEDDEGASSDAATPTAAPPPMAKGTFLDLSVEPAATPGAAAAGGLVAIGEETAAVVEATPSGLQAADFGLEEESSDTDSDASDQGAAAAVGVPSLSGLTGGNDGPITDASTAPGTLTGNPAGSRSSDPQTTASSKYEDRQKGMTMEERLANLEFSDCEDEDDDPLGIGSKS